MRKNNGTYYFDEPPLIVASAGVAGKKEGEGPLKNYFDAVFEDTTMGVNSFEQAESAMLHDAFIRALSKAGKSPSEIDMVMCGDLLDQCVGSCFALKDLEMPFVGMYGACSTMALTLCNACLPLTQGQTPLSSVLRATLLPVKDSFVFRLNTEDSDRRLHSGRSREQVRQ